MRKTILAALLAAGLHAAPILQLDPSNGAISGLPGSTVGWGFTLTNSTNYLVVNSVTFSASSPVGTFEGIAQNVFRIVGPLGLFSDGPTWTEAFNNGVPTGLARFIISGSAAAGAVLSGQIALGYDLFSVSPDDPVFDPGTDFVESGLLVVDASVTVQSSGGSTGGTTGGVGEIPEPSTVGLLTIGLAALLWKGRRGAAQLAVVAAVAAAAAGSASAQTAPLTCVAQSAGTPSIRSEGMAEQVGDVIISCQGGTPTFPQAYTNIQVFTSPSINITSPIVDVPNDRNDMLLLIDEPMPGSLVVCTTPQDPTLCLTANVFPSRSRGLNSATFTIPFTPPGTTSTRVLRLVNTRVNASQLGVPPGSQGVVKLLVSASASPLGNPIAVPISNADPTVAIAQPSSSVTLVGSVPLYQCGDVNRELALSASAPSTSDGRFFSIRLAESTFPSAYRRRNAVIPPFLGDPPAPVAQDFPGITYQTETVFFSPTFPGVYAAAGLATSGTRFFVRVHGVPVGVSLFTPTVISVGASGWMKLVAGTDGNGAGAFSAKAATTAALGGIAPMEVLGGGVHQAIFEVAHTETTSFENTVVRIYPAFLASSVGLGTLRFTAGYAPLSTDAGASANAPVPRFRDYSLQTDVARIEACPILTQLTVAKTGVATARQWTFSAKNTGGGTAYSARISSVALTQTGGPACSPIVSGGVPATAGDITSGNTAPFTPVTINFGSCAAAARFTVNVTALADNGYVTALSLTNQFR